jgi:aarF domain-containing kinase
LVDEAVAAVDALSREALGELLRAFLGSVPAALSTATVSSLGVLRPLLLPLPTPVEVLTRCAVCCVTVV